ncbi:GmrSD restriction endonuclease domain-containing protein [Orrella marina]|uniref:GmrSD restriction endonucleases N-terminal domain-containing protein n=1 Tax=Orrella marina TaxID=2163011 RepID=A0A2R4XF09_9BURK|nr:DUF262 domain-containing protein [Orrella marina]AWB32396.1 hypothetical protein DBV39_00235 [Orrella marina]
MIQVDEAENRPVPVEDETSEEAVEYKFDLTFYGADYPVDGLVKRLNQKDIIIPSFDPTNELAFEVEAFQRKFIWSKVQCDRFVESLLLGLPVPGIFLVQQSDKRLLVLDGQQRLLTMKAFYDGLLNRKEFALKHVQTQFQEKTYKTLDDDERRTLDDAIIHATVIKKTSEDQDLSSIYTLFERLNSGGTTLSPHEIRVALAPGKLMRLIRNLNETPAWRTAFGTPSKNLKDHELILRFIALMFSRNEYTSPMKDFLTNYAQQNQNLEHDSSESIEKAFTGAIVAVSNAVSSKPFRISTALNAAIFDSVMVGLAKRQLTGASVDSEKVAKAYEALLRDKNYQDAVGKATAREDQVNTRLRLAIEAFKDV